MRFIADKVPFDNVWLIKIDDPEWVDRYNVVYKSSYNVIAARLLGLSYGNYLRFLRSKGGTLKGKEGYSYAYFKDSRNAKDICDMLNERWQKVQTYFK